MQARSTASVEAILQATVQVLLRVGKDRLTTTRVAQRSGVSVGTLYQYFPNKSALLQAALQRHLDVIVEAVERVCRAQAGSTLQQMAEAMITAYMEGKTRDVKASVALYAVSSDVDGAKLRRKVGLRLNKAMVAAFATASDTLTRDPELVALMLQGALAGVSQRLLESTAPEKQYAALRQELIFFVHAYLKQCSDGTASAA